MVARSTCGRGTKNPTHAHVNPTEAADEKEVLLTNHLIKNWRGCENTVWHLERNKIGNI